MGKAIDLTKQEFERLTAIRPTEKRAADGSIIWECLCFCGKIHPASSSHLRSGHTKSCGCLKVDSMSMLFKTHGMSESLIYLVWKAMLNRCENPKNKSYKNYGGRGITVCERWHTFENFYADVGDPLPEMTLERKDNDGDYKPKNFRWATRKEQVLNCRLKSCGRCRQRWFLAFNLNAGEWVESNNQSEFAREYKFDSPRISECLHGKRKTHKGWTFEFLPYQQNGMDK